MKKRSIEESRRLEEALSPIVNRLIDKNYEESQDKIALQMAPLMGEAIRKQIQSQKDDVVDALYPVIGNMISRYVTKTLEDMLDKINTQIQNGLSLKALKRKVVSRIKGVSETELLLSEHAATNIRALLLIHKETGLVLAHSENPNSPVSDPDMLASMMSAIRSFINEWIAQNSVHKELGEIEYGGNKIIIESAGYCYLAVIIEGSAYKVTYDKIRTTLEQIILHHGENIRSFNGDLEKFANIEIYKEISTLLTEETSNTPPQTKQKKHPLLFLIPLFVFFWLGYNYYQSYKAEQLLIQVEEKLYKTPQLTPYRIETQLDGKVLIIKGEVPFKYYKELASEIAHSVKGVKSINNNIVVVDSLRDPMQISTNIAYLLKGLNLSPAYNVRYNYDMKTLILEGSVWSTKELQQLQNLFDHMQGIKQVKYKVTIQPPKLHKSVFFKKDSTKLTDEATVTLLQTLDLLSHVDQEQSIMLSAYSDGIGSIEHNRILSTKRLTTVERFLHTHGATKHQILTQKFDRAPDDVNAKLEPYKARQVLIGYSKEED